MSVYVNDRALATASLSPHAPPQSQFAAVPDELKRLRQWVVWRYLARNGKRTKVPFRASLPQAEASTTDPSTFGEFGEAMEAYLDQANRLDGIGFVFTTDDGIAGIDLDNCLDDQGRLLDWAREYASRIVGYGEKSPSGRGVKFFVRGSVPDGKGRKLQRLGPDGKGAIEVYDRGRYFTVTGVGLDDDHRELGDGSRALDLLHAEWFPPKASRPRTAASAPLALDDQVIIEKASRASNGAKFSRLFGGSIDGHPSKSEADLALCSHLAFWTGGDVEAIDRLFRQSALCDDKWTERSGYYRDVTIAKACERSTFYEPTYRSGRTSVPADLRVVPAPESPKTPRPAVVVGDDPGQCNLTDTGNADRLVKHFGHCIRFCAQYGKWLAWDGRRWKEDSTGEIFRLAGQTVRRIAAEASQTEDHDQRKALLKWAIESESRNRIDAMIYLARYVQGIPVEPAELDRNRMLLTARNGTIDLRTGEIGPHRREDLITKLADVDYDPSDDCPRWKRFEREIMNDDDAMIGYLRRIAGYALTGDVSEHSLFFFFGGGRNGKSVWLNTVQRILGDYATTVNASLITAKYSDDHPTGLTDLEGRRFVATVEVEDGKKLAESLVKQLTGGDPIRARRMRQDFYQFAPTHKIILAANHKPEIRGRDEAIWERIKLVPFDVTFVEADRVDPAKKFLLKDKQLSTTLEAENSGILALLVRSCLEWQKSGMSEPSAVSSATAEYRAEMDELADFIEERCVVSEQVRVKATALYDAYVVWAKARSKTAMLTRAFGAEMECRSYTLKKSNSVAWRLGIGVREE